MTTTTNMVKKTYGPDEWGTAWAAFRAGAAAFGALVPGNLPIRYPGRLPGPAYNRRVNAAELAAACDGAFLIALAQGGTGASSLKDLNRRRWDQSNTHTTSPPTGQQPGKRRCCHRQSFARFTPTT